MTIPKQSKETAICSKSAATMMTIPNLFHDPIEWDTSTSTVEQSIARAGAVSSNMYMVIEAMKKHAKPDNIHILQTLMKERGWSPVHSDFINTYYNIDNDQLDIIC